MSQVTMEMVKQLRERTGVGMSKCKEALELSGGDLEKAIDHLRKTGFASAVKKEGRETKEGAIALAENSDGLAVVEIDAETDFVVKNDRFQKFLKEAAEDALKHKPASLEAFMEQKMSHDSSLTVDQERMSLMQSLGENIKVSRVKRFEKKKDHSYATYAHMGGKIVTLVELSNSGQETLAKEIAMHIAAEDPQYLSQDDVPEATKEHEKEIGRAQVKGKPENVVEKIVEGKLNAFFDQVCLLRQKFIKDPSVTIGQLVEKRGKEVGKPLHVVRFLRWRVGESN